MSALSQIFVFIIVFIPFALIQIFIPMLTRRTESFGVSIPADQYRNPDIANMRKTYAIYVTILSVITLLIMVFISRWELALPILLIAYLIVSFIIYLAFHKRMKEFKDSQDWKNTRKQIMVVDTKFREQKLTHPNGWFVIGLLITLATLILTLVMYDKIPAKIPTHYDFEGNVNNWTTKSYRSVLLMPVIQLYMLGLFVFINAMIGRAKAMIDPDAPEASIQKNVIFRRRWSAFMIIMGTALVILFSLIQLTLIYDINGKYIGYASLGFGALMIIATLILSFTTGQGGSRIKRVGENDPTVINRDDDKYWKMGIFYFNPKDPALFIEKRFGIGWTNNFGHPLSWVIIIAIIAVVTLIPIFLH